MVVCLHFKPIFKNIIVCSDPESSSDLWPKVSTLGQGAVDLLTSTKFFEISNIFMLDLFFMNARVNALV